MKHLFRYINYLLSAKSRYRVHSPFVFDLIEKVIRNKVDSPYFDRIESLRRQLAANSTELKVMDFGTGGQKQMEYSSSIARIAKRSAVSPREGRLLYNLVQYFRPERILELGTSLGLGTAYLAATNDEAKVSTIEGSPATARIAEKNLEFLELSNIEVFTGEFSEHLHPVLKKMQMVDMVYFDGNHRKMPTLEYFEACKAYAHSDALFIFDDIHWSKEMEEAWKIICSDGKVTLSIDLFSLGMVFFRKEITKQHHVLRY